MTNLPAIQIDSVRKVFDDGNHNGFTDLCRFNGRMYLCFRSSPGGHMLSSSSRAVVLSSDDGVEWEQVHTFSLPDRDVRDPHFLPFKDQLFVYVGSWYCGDLAPGERPEMNEQLGYGAVSADGQTWSEGGTAFLPSLMLARRGAAIPALETWGPLLARTATRS